ncbi:MAG TPA: YdcH family protein [Kofleriaceae bacterium]|nr:YdcH family protein [Kofleriaceae bacterium]
MKAIDAGSKDQVLASLIEEHRRLDDRLRSLDGQRFLTSAEQIEYGQLKKMKLLTKDRIERLRITA